MRTVPGESLEQRFDENPRITQTYERAVPQFNHEEEYDDEDDEVQGDSTFITSHIPQPKLAQPTKHLRKDFLTVNQQESPPKMTPQDGPWLY